MIDISLEKATQDELVIGINKCIENAQALYSDGKLLYDNNRYERAYTLYQIAIEEIGKSQLLYSLLIDLKMGNAIDWKKANDRFLHHNRKSKASITYEMGAIVVMAWGKQNDGKEIEELKQYLKNLQAEGDDVSKLANKLKKASLYVDMTDKGFTTPDEVITKEIVDEITMPLLIRIKAAETFIKFFLQDIDTMIPKMIEVRDDPNYQVDGIMLELFAD